MGLIIGIEELRISKSGIKIGILGLIHFHYSSEHIIECRKLWCDEFRNCLMERATGISIELLIDLKSYR